MVLPLLLGTIANPKVYCCLLATVWNRSVGGQPNWGNYRLAATFGISRWVDPNSADPSNSARPVPRSGFLCE